MPCKIPHTVIMCIRNFNLGSIMPVHQSKFNFRYKNYQNFQKNRTTNTENLLWASVIFLQSSKRQWRMQYSFAISILVIRFTWLHHHFIRVSLLCTKFISFLKIHTYCTKDNAKIIGSWIFACVLRIKSDKKLKKAFFFSFFPISEWVNCKEWKTWV